MGKELQGEVAIITGAGRGIGRAIAERFAAAGAAVTLTSRTESQLVETLTGIERAGWRGLAVAGDITKKEDVARVVQASEERFGPTMLLVNNAGVPGPFGPIGSMDPDEWWASQAVHIFAPFLFISAVLPGMIARGGGRILSISSPRCHMLTPNLSAYSLGKTGQNRLTEFVAAESGSHGVKALSLDPGSIMTDMADITMKSPDAQRWVPGMVDRLHQLKGVQVPGDGMDWCLARCMAFATGRYDALSGRYIDRTDDPEMMLQTVSAG